MNTIKIALLGLSESGKTLFSNHVIYGAIPKNTLRQSRGLDIDQINFEVTGQGSKEIAIWDCPGVSNKTIQQVALAEADLSIFFIDARRVEQSIQYIGSLPLASSGKKIVMVTHAHIAPDFDVLAVQRFAREQHLKWLIVDLNNLHTIHQAIQEGLLGEAPTKPRLSTEAETPKREIASAKPVLSKALLRNHDPSFAASVAALTGSFNELASQMANRWRNFDASLDGA